MCKLTVTVQTVPDRIRVLHSHFTPWAVAGLVRAAARTRLDVWIRIAACARALGSAWRLWLAGRLPPHLAEQLGSVPSFERQSLDVPVLPLSCEFTLASWEPDHDGPDQAESTDQRQPRRRGTPLRCGVWRM